MRMWGCEDTNKYLEYMNLKIRGCKDARIQARTHEPKGMRMRGYKHLHRCKIHISISISRSIYLYTWSIYLMILCSLHLYSGARYTKHYPIFQWANNIWPKYFENFYFFYIDTPDLFRCCLILNFLKGMGTGRVWARVWAHKIAESDSIVFTAMI